MRFSFPHRIKVSITYNLTSNTEKLTFSLTYLPFLFCHQQWQVNLYVSSNYEKFIGSFSCVV